MKKVFLNTLSLLFALGFLYSCKKKEIQVSTPLFDSIYDVDSNVYKTVKIGNQWWMAENLKVRKFRNGTAISEAKNITKWIKNTASYCLYEDNKSSPGLLYNWFAVNDSNQLAPKGWHIPTDEDWKVLEKQLGMTQQQVDSISWRGTHEGEKLKVAGVEGWSKFENVWPTNITGFTALAGSCRLPNGTWGDPGLFCTGFWWTSSSNLANNTAWYRHLDYKTTTILRHSISKNYGMSIRCVKD